jgi:hypothetical protein
MTLVSRFCHMSSVRSTSDSRGPVTPKRVPDREEQGKPSKDARRGRCHPLEAGFWPLWMTPLPRNTITEYRIQNTPKRVPDRESQGKPSKDARRGRCHPLEAGFWPLWMTPLQRTTITEYRIQTGKDPQACSVAHCGLHEKFTFLPFTAEKQTFHATLGS